MWWIALNFLDGCNGAKVVAVMQIKVYNIIVNLYIFMIG